MKPLLLLGAGAALLASVTEISARARGWYTLYGLSPHAQFVALAVGIALVTWGAAYASRRAPAAAPVSRGVRREWLMVAAITALALLLRLWNAGGAIRVLVDELHFVGGVVDFWKPDKQIGLLTPMTNISPFTWVYPYWQWVSVGLFGRDLFSLRAVSGVIGALTVPALYLLARTLFDRRTALLAALLLTTFPPHLHYSRIALLSISDGLVGTLLFAFLARGIRHGQRADWALAGMCFGLTQYFYEGGRLLYPPLALAWLLLWWGVRPRRPPPAAPAAPRPYGHLLAFGVTALLVGAPVYIVLAAGGSPLAGRMGASGLDGAYWRDLLLSPPASGMIAAHLSEHVAPAFLAYVARPDPTRYYGGSTALTLPFVAPFFLVGAALALWRIRTPGGLLLTLWLLATALGNSLLLISGASTRYVVAFPALALAAALGLSAVFAAAQPRVRQRGPLLAALLAGGLLAGQAVYYFGPHLARFEADFRETRPHFDIDDAVFRARALPPGTRVHVISRTIFDRGYARSFLAFFRDDIQADGYVTYELTADILAALPRDVLHAFFIEPDDGLALRRLRTAFGRLEGPFASPHPVAPDKMFVMFLAPAEAES